ncbi:MAG TPA: AMP-binding protein [Frankiaceae bacterium]|jgi:fatty-acyl-CoA synthase|nr:AMP-binding protein [Frankiaceae bacterium]
MGISSQLTAIRVLAGAGAARPSRPDRLLGMGLALMRWGFTPAAGWAAGAVRYPHEAAIIDELGAMTFLEIDQASSGVATALTERGVRDGGSIGLLMRNSRWMPIALSAVAKAGADAVLLNTGFGAEQLGDVMQREGIQAVIYDEEFDPLLAEAPADLLRVVGWSDGEVELPTVAELADTPPRLTRPAHRGRQVILTSGTTGTPKGASRSVEGIEPAAAFLSGIPLRARETTVIAAPLFHAWGLAHLGLGLLLSSTLVLSRRFDPERLLALVDEHRASALVVVPVMMQRMLELPEKVRERYDTSSLKVVAVSGSALPGELSTRFMDAFGEVVHNLYGSTEVAYATVASPADLREAPGTAGRLLLGTTITLVDPEGNEVPQGEVGRIFVGNPLLFTGYTGGEDKDRLGNLVASGDLGRFDAQGRLFIEGRDDEMIVSGGENVFPAEVEELLSKHPSVREAAVVGVEDEKMGQRLVAYVVKHAKSVSEDELKALVKDRLARHKVPREVHFIDELPRNETGKIVKRKLQAPDCTESGGGS